MRDLGQNAHASREDQLTAHIRAAYSAPYPFIRSTCNYSESRPSKVQVENVSTAGQGEFEVEVNLEKCWILTAGITCLSANGLFVKGNDC